MVRLTPWIVLLVIAPAGLAGCDSGDDSKGIDTKGIAATELKNYDNMKRGAAKWSDATVPHSKKSKRDVYEEAWGLCGIASTAYEDQAESPTPEASARTVAKENYPPILEQPAFEGCLLAFQQN
jgi:hypothetical protein